METIKDYNSSTSFFEGCISFITDICDEENLYHRCYKIIVSLDNSFDCLVDGQRLTGLRALIVNQSVSHTISSSGATVMVSFFETESFRGWQLRALLKEQACFNMDRILSSYQLKHVLPANHKNLSDKTLLTFVKIWIENIFITPPSYNCLLRKPMQRALLLIDQNLNSPLEAEDIAEKINMTPENFRYFFVEYMSIPFARYVTWKRIRIAIATVTSNKEFKYSGSNLHDTLPGQIKSDRDFNQIFGFSVNALINNSRVLL